MHAFVVVGAKPGRAIPDGALAVLTDARPAEVTFAPDDHVHWADEAGRLHFAGWQAEGEHLGVLSRWDVRPAGLTAFSGLVWLRAAAWTGGSSWAAQLADALAREPLRHAAPHLDGVGAVASLSAAGTGAVTADPLGVAILYVAETPEMTVVGTRAALVARVVAGLRTSLRRDVEGAGWVAYANNVQTDRSTFEGVRTVPQGSVVRFDGDRAPEVETWSAMPWLDGPALTSPAALEEALDASTAHLRSLARLLATVAPATTLELTGGRDTRLVLSLLVAEDLAHEVDCATWGDPTLPDVVVATEIADLLGLGHRASSRSALRPRPRRPARHDDRVGPGPSAAARYEAQLRHHVWLTSGARSVWDLRAAPAATSPGVALTGLFGELLRTNTPRADGIRNGRDLHTYVVAGRLGADGARLLRPEVRRHYDRLVCEQLDGLLPAGGTPQDALDGFNQAVRLRRWFAPAHELDHRNRVFPLYSLAAVRTAFGLGSVRRRSELLTFEVMRRCSDELARLPFAGAPWPARATELTEDPAAYVTAGPVPPWQPPPFPRARYRLGRWRMGLQRSTLRATHERAPTSVVEVGRMRDLDVKIPVLHGLVDLDRNHAFFDLVDRRALHRSIDGLDDLGHGARRAVHDAVTAALWLSGGEAPSGDLRP